MDAHDEAEMDQSFALLSETYPPALYRFFKNLVIQGFDDQQALRLTETFLNGLVTKPDQV